jgi:hypothetical protein
MKLKANKPVHGLGEHGKAHRMGGLMAGAHVPQRTNSGYDDRKGYSGNGQERRNGKQSGKLKVEGDTRVRKGPEGNSKGSPPPGVSKGKPASLDAHKGTSGRGGPGRIGKPDNWKGGAPKMSEEISHSAFEKLGAD